MSKTKKSKKAPKYFVKRRNKVENVIEEASEIIGYSKSWLSEQLKDGFNPEDHKERLDSLTGEERVKFNVLLQIGQVYLEYAWAIFRYKNIGNEFGQSPVLSYDPKDETIEIPEKNENLMEKVKSALTGKK